jgi:hypothetical protein
VTIVGIDDNLLYNNLGVYHDEFQRMLAGSCLEAGIKPSDVIKDLITTL